MRRRIRSTWLEIAAGFELLFAAKLAYDVRPVFSSGIFGSPADLSSLALLLAGCAVFLLHAVRQLPTARRACFAVAALTSLPSAWWLVRNGWNDVAILLILLGVWFAAAAAFRAWDPPPQKPEERSMQGIALYVAATLVAVGISRFAHLDGRAVAAGLACVAAAAILVYAEYVANRRLRLYAAAAGGAVVLSLALRALSDSGAAAAGAFLALFGALLLSVAIPYLPEAADEMSGAPERQREMCLHQRACEAILWAVMALSILYMNRRQSFDAHMYFLAFFSAALVTQFGFRARPVRALTERSYLFALFGMIGVSLLLMAATGGAGGPFVYLAYLSVYAGTVIVAPSWSIVTAGVYVAYILADAIGAWWRGGAPHAWADLAPGLSQASFLAASVLLIGGYTAWTGRRRAKHAEALMAANRRLAESLRSAVREREQSERRSIEQKKLNDDLLEMRSALMNVLEDVQESKRQLELDRRREFASLNALGEGVIATAKDGAIFLCNPAGAALLGLDAKTVVGQPLERTVRLFEENGSVLQTGAFETAFAGKATPLSARLVLLREDGRRVPVSGSVAPYFDEENRLAGVVLAFRDVTVEREIDRQKSDFISIASHQLRTPLSALRWFLDLLLAGDAGALKPRQKEYLEDMSVSTVRMIKLVGDLLNITRIESGRITPRPQRVDVAAFAGDLAREHAPLFKSREIHFAVQVDARARTIYVDPALAHQAVANVLSNAVKYTPSGGRVDFSVGVDGRMVVFSVRDTGVGIPQAQQYRVYDKFFRGENVVAQETGGSGLGLYVTKLIIELSGGQIWFESKEGRGTTFSMALPTAVPEGTMPA